MGKRHSKARRRCSSVKYRAEGTQHLSPTLPAVRDQMAHTDAVASVAFLAPDCCASGGKDKAVVVCNWQHRSMLRKFWGHEQEITKVCCLPNWVFSASRDKTVRMWGLRNGASGAVRCFSGHDLVVSGVAVSPAFPQICTGSRDNCICTWDMETGTRLRRASISRNVVTHLCWVPGEPYVAQTSEDKTIRLWDARGLEVAHIFPAKKQIQTSCDVSPDGRYCLSTSSGFGHEGGEATLWDLRQAKGCVREFWGHTQTASSGIFLAPGPAGFPEIATAAHDGTVKVWSLETGACLSTAFLEGAGPLSSLAPCGKAAFLCGSAAPWICLMQIGWGREAGLQEAASFEDPFLFMRCNTTMLVTLAVQGDQLEAATRYGRLRGMLARVTGSDQPVSIFLGIPFAKPPVGDLRFSPPQPPEPWGHTKEATSYPPMCLQDPEEAQTMSDGATNRKEKIAARISEDCLYLNVYTTARLGDQLKLPVMVWIHGGGLQAGGASTFDGSALAAYENMVVVVIQYRLGLLGFFSTGDDHAPGNWGFLDQLAALRWIQNNIGFFGGDPGSVTLFGGSAGGGSISAHVLSPASKGLFHKAISQSGVALIRTFVNAHPECLAKKVVEAAGCPGSSSSQMVHYLRGKTEDEILEIARRVDFMFSYAVVDGVFLPKSPERLLEEKNISNVPYIIGVNNHESGWLIPTALQFPNLTKGFDKETACRILPTLVLFTGVAESHTYLLVDEYLADVHDPRQIRDRLLDLIGDVSFVVPGIKVARGHRDAGYPVYFYEFQHPPSWLADLRPDFVQADHGDEIGFVFGQPFLADEGTEEEKKMSKRVMKYWANFARHGNPNGAGLVDWPLYDGNERYLEIGIKQKVARSPREKQVEFWIQTLPEKLNESQGHREMCVEQSQNS